MHKQTCTSARQRNPTQHILDTRTVTGTSLGTFRPSTLQHRLVQCILMFRIGYSMVHDMQCGSLRDRVIQYLHGYQDRCCHHIMLQISDQNYSQIKYRILEIRQEMCFSYLSILAWPPLLKLPPKTVNLHFSPSTSLSQK